jgi:ribonuclease P protein component
VTEQVRVGSEPEPHAGRAADRPAANATCTAPSGASEVSGASEAFRPAHRVKRRADFRRVQSSGRKIHTPHFVVAVLPRVEGGPTRLGITVTRKIAGAVGRNRVKRVMREVFRRHRELFPSACDVVAIAKGGAHELGYAEVLGELQGAQRALAAAQRPRAERPHAERPRAERSRGTP